MTTGQLTPTNKLWRAITADIDDERLTGVLDRSLSDVERTTLDMRFGLTGQPTTTLEETGEQLDVTADDVRKIEALALRKIRTSMVG